MSDGWVEEAQDNKNKITQWQEKARFAWVDYK
jgi:hypothetical protein